MHILRIADVPNNRTGGMSRVMYGSGDALAALGHQVDYFFHEDMKVSGDARLRRFTVPLRLPHFVRDLARKGKRYDVVEIHEPLSAPYCLARKSDRLLPPVTIMSHGIEERGRLLTLAYRQRKGLRVSLKQRYSPLSVVFQAMYGLRHANHVLSSNQEDIDYLIAHGVSAQRLTRHFNGVEPSFIEAGQTIARDKAALGNMLFMGTWIERKGILDLAPAVSQTLHYNPQSQFTAAGCAVSRETVLAAFAPELHSRVHVLPKITADAELREVYKQHGIFVLPSYAEGQPLVMIEAAAMGMAIVTTRVSGMPDFIDDGENGLLVPVGDPQALAQSLIRLVNTPALVREFGSAALNTARSHTWLHSARNIAAAYEKAMTA